MASSHPQSAQVQWQTTSFYRNITKKVRTMNKNGASLYHKTKHGQTSEICWKTTEFSSPSAEKLTASVSFCIFSASIAALILSLRALWSTNSLTVRVPIRRHCFPLNSAIQIIPNPNTIGFNLSGISCTCVLQTCEVCKLLSFKLRVSLLNSSLFKFPAFLCFSSDSFLEMARCWALFQKDLDLRKTQSRTSPTFNQQKLQGKTEQLFGKLLRVPTLVHQRCVGFCMFHHMYCSLSLFHTAIYCS